MQANMADPQGNADVRQLEWLCDELGDRAAAAQEEQVLLEQLVRTTAPMRPFRARRYQMLLDEVRAKSRRFSDLIMRFCRHPEF